MGTTIRILPEDVRVIPEKAVYIIDWRHGRTHPGFLKGLLTGQEPAGPFENLDNGHVLR